MAQRLRQLQPGESIPTATPKRYPDRAGYVRLRWTIAPNEQVEIREHRVVSGVVIPAAVHVHHKNGKRDDNRPVNLEFTTASAHAKMHNPMTWDVQAAHRDYERGLSLPKLSERYGVHCVTIMRTFKRNGLPVRTITEAWVYRKRPVVDTSAVIASLLSGVRVNALAKQYGCSRGPIETIRINANIPAFPAGRP